jgi:DNA-binding NarL/FixJ family response regulator
MIRSILQTRDWTICGEAADGWAGIGEFRKLRPDVVVIDFTMPGISGLETARWMAILDPNIPLILFTLSDTDELRKAADQAGFYAVVSKMNAWDLISAIESAASHGQNVGNPTH